MNLINRISKFLKKNNPASQKEDKLRIRDYVGKFVHQSGTKIGESIAIEKDRIVIKSSGTFMSIPLEKIVANTESIIVEDFNREESLQLGKEWFERRDVLKFDQKGMLIMSNPKSQ